MFDEAHGSVFLSEHGAAQKSESGRSVFTIIDSLQAPLERCSRQSMVVLPTIRGKCACFRAKMVKISGHLPILTSGISGSWRTILVSKTLSGFPRQLIHRILLPFSAIRMVGFTYSPILSQRDLRPGVLVGQPAIEVP